MWPIMLGLSPNEAAYSILQKSLGIPAAAFCSCATCMVYQLIQDGDVAGLRGLDEIPPDADVRAQLRWDPRIHPTAARATQHIPCAVVYAVCALVPSRCRIPVCVQASTGAWLAIALWDEAPDTLMRSGSASCD